MPTLTSTRKSDNRCRWYSECTFLDACPNDRHPCYLVSPKLTSIKRYGVYMISYAKVGYCDEIHQICGSHTHFLKFDLELAYPFLTGKSKRFITALLFYIHFFVSFGQNFFFGYFLNVL